MSFSRQAWRTDVGGHIEVGDHDEQELVRAHFRSTMPVWSELYNERSLYRRIYSQRRDAVLEMVDRLRLPPRSRILEIGCGPGVMTVALAQRGYCVTAVDLVFDMAEATARLAAGVGVGPCVSLGIADVHHLPFSDNRFDLVLAIGVTEWLPGLRGPMMEIARVIRHEGFAILSTDNRWALHAFLDPLLSPVLDPVKRKLRNLLHQAGFWAPYARPRSYSVREFALAVSETGLKKVAGTTLGFGPFSFFRRRIMPNSIGLRVHQMLQRLADRHFPIVKSAGHVCLLLATKA